MLKFEDKVEICQRVRAFDFQPMKGREDCYIEGRVTGISIDNGVKAFVVRCSKDSWDELDGGGKFSRVGHAVLVPMEVAFMEYDNRIVVL